MAEGIFHIIWYHAQYINQEELAGRGRALLVDRLGVGQQVLHLFLLGFIPLSPFFITTTVIKIIAIIISFFVSFIKLILIQVFHLFLFFLPIPPTSRE